MKTKKTRVPRRRRLRCRRSTRIARPRLGTARRFPTNPSRRPRRIPPFTDTTTIHTRRARRTMKRMKKISKMRTQSTLTTSPSTPDSFWALNPSRFARHPRRSGARKRRRDAKPPGPRRWKRRAKVSHDPRPGPRGRAPSAMTTASSISSRRGGKAAPSSGAPRVPAAPSLAMRATRRTSRRSSRRMSTDPSTGATPAVSSYDEPEPPRSKSNAPNAFAPRSG